ncbi:hypothetical protein EAO73_02680 [Streptomyces sp. col6]|nr:hypothetical protein EAO73_02680 [Streptomyces sp. col6]
MVAMLAPVALVAATLPAVTLEEAHVRVAAGTVSVGLVALAVYAPFGVADHEAVAPADAEVAAIPRAALAAVAMMAALRARVFTESGSLRGCVTYTGGPLPAG